MIFIGPRHTGHSELDRDGDAIDLRRFALVMGDRWLPLEALVQAVEPDAHWLALELDASNAFRDSVRKCFVITTSDACTLVCVVVDEGMQPDVGEG
jgi:hypothetical protein